jgi:hypothetical protein
MRLAVDLSGDIYLTELSLNLVLPFAEFIRAGALLLRRVAAAGVCAYLQRPSTSTSCPSRLCRNGSWTRAVAPAR